MQQNAFESVVCEKAAILSRPQWDNMADGSCFSFPSCNFSLNLIIQGWEFVFLEKNSISKFLLIYVFLITDSNSPVSQQIFP